MAEAEAVLPLTVGDGLADEEAVAVGEGNTVAVAVGPGDTS